VAGTQTVNDLDGTPDLATGVPGRGPSLVVWAIAEGRKAADALDAYLGRFGSGSRNILGWFVARRCSS